MLSWRYLIPATILTSVTPPYVMILAFWRLCTLPFFTKPIYEIGEEAMWASYQRFILLFFENILRTKLILHGDMRKVEEFGHENVLCIFNHQSSVDWIVTDMVALRAGCLGQVRFIAKDELKWIPMFGWYFFEHGCVYVKRGHMAFKSSLMDFHLNRLRQRYRPGWLVVFPEGTRFDVEKPTTIEKSREWAEHAELRPALDHVLAPRIRGFHSALQILRDRVDAVYDITVLYADCRSERGTRLNAPTMTEFLLTSGREVHVHMTRYNVSDVPASADKLSRWLYDRFVEKDRLLAQYITQGTTPDCGAISTLKLSETLPHALLWTIATLGPFAVFKWSRWCSLYAGVCVGVTTSGYVYLHLKSAA